jgi:hypothetical protein
MIGAVLRGGVAAGAESAHQCGAQEERDVTALALRVSVSISDFGFHALRDGCCIEMRFRAK